jgi:hypothetical protein
METQANTDLKNPAMAKVIPHPNPKSVKQPKGDTPEGTIECHECGQHLKSLSRHLATHGMSVEQYHAKHGSDAPILAEGVKAGRKAVEKRNPAAPLLAVEGDLFARANKIDLAELDALARDKLTDISKGIQDALCGRSDASRMAFALAYLFSRRVVANPGATAALPNWAESATKKGSNLFYRPLKYLTFDMCEEIRSCLSTWAAVMENAASRKMDGNGFVAELTRIGGRRPWYDSLKKGPRRKDDGKGEGNGTTDEEDGSVPKSISVEEARKLLMHAGIGKEEEVLSTEEGRELLGKMGFQIEPDTLSAEEARKLFPAPLSMVVWRADILPSVKATLEAMEGFVQILDLDAAQVAKIVKDAGNDNE